MQLSSAPADVLASVEDFLLVSDLLQLSAANRHWHAYYSDSWRRLHWQRWGRSYAAKWGIDEREVSKATVSSSILRDLVLDKFWLTIEAAFLGLQSLPGDRPGTGHAAATDESAASGQQQPQQQLEHSTPLWKKLFALLQPQRAFQQAKPLFQLSESFTSPTYNWKLACCVSERGAHAHVQDLRTAGRADAAANFPRNAGVLLVAVNVPRVDRSMSLPWIGASALHGEFRRERSGRKGVGVAGRRRRAAGVYGAIQPSESGPVQQVQVQLRARLSTAGNNVGTDLHWRERQVRVAPNAKLPRQLDGARLLCVLVRGVVCGIHQLDMAKARRLHPGVVAVAADCSPRHFFLAPILVRDFAGVGRAVLHLLLPVVHVFRVCVRNFARVEYPPRLQAHVSQHGLRSAAALVDRARHAERVHLRDRREHCARDILEDQLLGRLCRLSGAATAEHAPFCSLVTPRLRLVSSRISSLAILLLRQASKLAVCSPCCQSF